MYQIIEFSYSYCHLADKLMYERCLSLNEPKIKLQNGNKNNSIRQWSVVGRRQIPDC